MLSLLGEFENKIAERIGRPSDLRPFVCEGSPLDCNVFIVGYNPATSMNSGFWDFWRTDYGFQKSAWLEAYRAERLHNGKRALSNTRRVMNWICESAPSARVLETNLLWKPSRRKRDLAKQDRNLGDFGFLLDLLKPQVVVLHGSDANRHWDESRLDITVIREKHFAIGYSQDAAYSLGERIRNILSTSADDR